LVSPGQGATEAKTYGLSEKRAELNLALAARQPSLLEKTFGQEPYAFGRRNEKQQS